MSRIAIVDTAIDARFIGGKDITYIDLYEGSSASRNLEISHGTICAMVLDHCAYEYELISYLRQIFQ